MSTNQKQEPPVGVRLSAEAREFIKEQAKKNFRSLSKEVALRVERSIQEDLKAQRQGAAA